jgi:hypothetical protein
MSGDLDTPAKTASAFFRGGRRHRRSATQYPRAAPLKTRAAEIEIGAASGVAASVAGGFSCQA